MKKDLPTERWAHGGAACHAFPTFPTACERSKAMVVLCLLYEYEERYTFRYTKKLVPSWEDEAQEIECRYALFEQRRPWKVVHAFESGVDKNGDHVIRAVLRRPPLRATIC